MSDPFISATGIITPLQVNGSFDEYSVKISSKRTTSSPAQINVFAGTFIGDIEARAVGIQAAIMSSLESAIQYLLAEDYLIGELPSLGKPTTYTFVSNDTLVSFSDRNEWFIFKSSGFKFISLNNPDQDFITSGPVTSSLTGLIYTVQYTSATNFTINDNYGRTLVFNASSYPATTATYNGNILSPDQYISGSFTSEMYKTSPYTDVGITKLLGTLPVNPNDIVVAEGVAGFFYKLGTNVTQPTLQELATYLINRYNPPGFSTYQQSIINCICKTVFVTARNAVKHILNNPNLEVFSTGTGFGGFATNKFIDLEVRIS